MKNLFTIGEVSKLFDINAKTLRYYDEINLFKPSYVNKDNKYRYYTIDQFQYLETIHYLKELGLSLEKIKYHLNNVNEKEVILSLEEQNNIIDTKINELQKIKHKINNKIIQIKDSTRIDLLGTIRELDFKERHAIQLRSSIKSDNDIGWSLRKLTKMSSNNISLTYGMVGICISREKLIEREYGEYESIFVMIENEQYDKSIVKVFKEGTYICIRLKGVHKHTPPYYNQLIDYINEKGYKIIDDSIEMELVDPNLSLSEEEVVTEIQVLIEK